ncbi:AcrR family transcriptional regulator [Dietzia sp. 2505]|uniref:TetR/AcrR family transcriptional regulator n=1 Tax=Dietzia sp. 2505 TaxID=3156457 RepID=UPI00339B3CC7
MPRVSQDHMAARRREILSGARECFAEFGFEGATVRRLEETTGLSRGAIFHHFDDKDALFLALAHDDAAAMAATVAEQGLVQVMREILADPNEFSWLGTRLEIARRIRTDPAFRERWTDRQAELDEAILARLREQKDSGRMRTDVPDDVLRVYLDIVLDGLITHLATGRGTAHVSAMLDLVEASLRTGRE